MWILSTILRKLTAQKSPRLEVCLPGTQAHKDICALFKLESTMSHAFQLVSAAAVCPYTATITYSPKVVKITLGTELDSDPNSAIYLLSPLGNYLTSLVSFLSIN